MSRLISKKFLTTIALLSVVTCCSGIDSSVNPLDVLTSVGNILWGLGSELGNIIPSVGELFNDTKSVLFGFPEVAVFKVLGQMCSVYVASDKMEPRITPKAEEMYFQLRTPCKSVSIPILEADQISKNPEFDVNKKVVIFITGWMSNINSDYIEDMAKAYHCRGGYNFLALNTSNFVQTLYTWSAFNTEEVGRFVAQGLQKLATSVALENIHIVAHSLGAHIAGSAGRYFMAYANETLPRITGLDPANPCFNEGETLTGLYRGDAQFVDVIHTNPGVLGKRHPVGDIDFYPEGLTPIKPGCKIFSCSHSRAYEFFTETVYPDHELNFMAKRCTSLKHLTNGYCKSDSIPMGIATPNNIRGDYFLSVNEKAPFGKSAKKNAIVKPNACGQCKST